MEREGTNTGILWEIKLNWDEVVRKIDAGLKKSTRPTSQEDQGYAKENQCHTNIFQSQPERVKPIQNWASLVPSTFADLPTRPENVSESKSDRPATQSFAKETQDPSKLSQPQKVQENVPCVLPTKRVESKHPFTELLRIAAMIELNANEDYGSKGTENVSPTPVKNTETALVPYGLYPIRGPSLILSTTSRCLNLEEKVNRIVIKDENIKGPLLSFVKIEGENKTITKSRGRPRKDKVSLINENMTIAESHQRGEQKSQKRKCYYNSREKTRALLDRNYSPITQENDENEKKKSRNSLNRKSKLFNSNRKLNDYSEEDDPKDLTWNRFDPERNKILPTKSYLVPLTKDEARNVEHNCMPLTRNIVKRISLCTYNQSDFN